MAGDITVRADPGCDLERHADVHILHLLRHAIDARQGDRGEDRDRVTGDDLGGRSALRGDSRLADDPSLPFLDLGIDRRLDLAARKHAVGVHPEWQEVSGLDRSRCYLAARIGEIDAQRARSLLGQFDELSLKDDAVDRHVDHRDLVLDPRNPLRRALDPDGVEAAIDGEAAVDRLAERLFLLRRLTLRRRVGRGRIRPDRPEARLTTNEHIVRLDRHPVGKQANDLTDVGIFEHDQLIAILARNRVECGRKAADRNYFLARRIDRPAADCLGSGQALDRHQQGPLTTWRDRNLAWRANPETHRKATVGLLETDFADQSAIGFCVGHVGRAGRAKHHQAGSRGIGIDRRIAAGARRKVDREDAFVGRFGEEGNTVYGVGRSSLGGRWRDGRHAAHHER